VLACLHFNAAGISVTDSEYTALQLTFQHSSLSQQNCKCVVAECTKIQLELRTQHHNTSFQKHLILEKNVLE